jgi:hypothetical protein
MLMKVSKDGRVIIPQDASNSIEWLGEHKEKTIKGWVLIESFGRHRLYSEVEVETFPELAELREEVSKRGGQPKGRPLEFEEPENVVFSRRFHEVELHWSDKNGWRLVMPQVTINLWRIEKGEGHVGIVVNKGYIEIWSMETVQAAFSVPIEEMG